MKLLKHEPIFAMSNARGRYVVNPRQLPFSFYFSSGAEVRHAIRVKPSFNPEKLKVSQTGTLRLSGNWEYIPGPDDLNVPQKQIDEMKQFFRDYIVLFAAVWDEQMQDSVLEDYLMGRISFAEMLQDLEFYPEHKDALDQIQDVATLEAYCRDHNLVNLYGN